MAEITAALVKELREKTGAGMMDCKRALGETQGDLESAVDWLRKKGLAAAAKKAGRVASEGLVGVAVKGTAGALVEVNAETDFVARNETFQNFVRTVAAMALERERGVLREQAKASGKPDNILDKMVEGRLKKFYEDVVLLEQVYVVDGESRVARIVEDAAKESGAPLKLAGFARFALGEGIEKAESDFAAEVAAVAGVKPH